MPLKKFTFNDYNSFEGFLKNPSKSSMGEFKNFDRVTTTIKTAIKSKITELGKAKDAPTLEMSYDEELKGQESVSKIRKLAVMNKAKKEVAKWEFK